MSTTTLTDIHPYIIQSHILPLLDGPSLSATTAVSRHLHSLCSDNTLWASICNSTWPSIKHPTVDHLISTFPAAAGHRSFFHDSFPSLSTDVHHHHRRSSSFSEQKDCTNYPSELISAIDIRYQNDVVYSTVEFTDTGTPAFLSSAVQLDIKDDPPCNESGSQHVPRISGLIDLKVDEIAGADEATLSHLKESLTLSWILIDPTRKRAGNLSSIAPVTARQDWMGNETVIQYVTVLPGSDPDEMVQCKIQVVLGVSAGALGLHVKHVTLKLEDLSGDCLNGREFLIVTRGVISEEENVRKRVMNKEDRLKSRREFK